jgi:hypothetical protein
LEKHQDFSLETFAIAKFGTSYRNGHLPPITNFVKIFWVASFVMFEKIVFFGAFVSVGFQKTKKTSRSS